MIKGVNQKCIPFNKPIIYFYLIEVKFLSKRYLKTIMDKKNTLEDLGDIDFSCLLLTNINKQTN